MLKTGNRTMATLLTVSILAISLSGSPLGAQTIVDVPTNVRTDIAPPPACAFPCDKEFILPPFARRLSLAGPEGTFETGLDRRTFLNRLEDWRRYLEIYRRSIEEKQLAAPDWNEANIIYKVELGHYDQFFESYRNAIAMDRGGRITYGNRTL